MKLIESMVSNKEMSGVFIHEFYRDTSKKIRVELVTATGNTPGSKKLRQEYSYYQRRVLQSN